MYFVKLLSPIPKEKIGPIAWRLAPVLDSHPVRVEKALLKNQGSIAKASRLAKAEQLAYAFLSEGVNVAVEEKSTKSRSKLLTSTSTGQIELNYI